MIKRIKSLTNTEDKKRLMSNFFSLSVLQGANYILPLITLPYLVRVLGVEYFGLLAFAAATVMYFQILTDYGFNLTATREISIHRDNKAKVIEIFSSVMTIKVLLMFVSFLLLTILVFSFEKFSKDALVYFLTFGTVVGQVLFPVWFFQGMERMKYITYLNILSKVIFTIAIFVFVQEQSDFYLVPLLTSIGFLVAGAWSLYLVKKEFGVRFELQTIDTIKHHLVEGWHVFQQQFYVSMYGPINLIFLGFFTTNTIVGYYSIVEKILAVPLALFAVGVQAYYPYAVKLFNKSIEDYFIQIKKISITFIVFSFSMTTFIFIFSNEIVELTTGATHQKVIVDVLNILAIGIVFSSFGQFYTQIFVTLKKSKILNKISFRVMIMNLVISPIVIYVFGVIGLAYFILFRQNIVITTCYFYLQKFKKEYLRG
jgi:PST family polysaccharide transporter